MRIGGRNEDVGRVSQHRAPPPPPKKGGGWKWLKIFMDSRNGEAQIDLNLNW
jgi:hypothetical protein